ncbi:hypothetical protein LEMLEM_LOCUS26328 [Lemmus lemmus]
MTIPSYFRRARVPFFKALHQVKPCPLTNEPHNRAKEGHSYCSGSSWTSPAVCDMEDFTNDTEGLLIPGSCLFPGAQRGIPVMLRNPPG